MTIYITHDNKLHDDADGLALNFPSWPKDARIANQDEINAILNPQETPEQTLARLDAALVAHLNAVAKLSTWESIYTAMARAGFDGPFQADGLRHAKWADACFAKSIEIMIAVQNGERAIPTESELIAEMPLLPALEPAPEPAPTPTPA